jgi:hypothetical protein
MIFSSYLKDNYFRTGEQVEALCDDDVKLKTFCFVEDKNFNYLKYAKDNGFSFVKEYNINYPIYCFKKIYDKCVIRMEISFNINYRIDLQEYYKWD